MSEIVCLSRSLYTLQTHCKRLRSSNRRRGLCVYTIGDKKRVSYNKNMKECTNIYTLNRMTV